MPPISTVRRIIIVGIPGVGKSSVVSKLLNYFQTRQLKYKIVNYGTVMMEEASSLYGVKSRDEMRKLSLEVQQKLQVQAASQISKFQEDYVIVDTHLFIATSEGFWPGMPMDVLQALKPTNIVMIVAKPEEILGRRRSDTSRTRDEATKGSLETELFAASSFLYATSLVCGCPALVVSNPEGNLDSAVEKIIKAILSN